VSDGLSSADVLGLLNEEGGIHSAVAFGKVSIRRPIGTSPSDTGCPTYRWLLPK